MKSLHSKKLKPTHPGEILREDVLPELNIKQGVLAKALNVSRRTISQILNERRPVTADMAIRLERLLGTPAETWLNLQRELDLWLLEQDKEKVKEYNEIPQLIAVAA